MCDHIRKELIEVEAAPDDLREWIDVILLGLDGAWRTGASPEQITAALADKLARNERRTWPDWRTADPDRAIEHLPAWLDDTPRKWTIRVLVEGEEQREIAGEGEANRARELRRAITDVIESMGGEVWATTHGARAWQVWDCPKGTRYAVRGRVVYKARGRGVTCPEVQRESGQ